MAWRETRENGLADGSACAGRKLKNYGKKNHYRFFSRDKNIAETVRGGRKWFNFFLLHRLHQLSVRIAHETIMIIVMTIGYGIDYCGAGSPTLAGHKNDDKKRFSGRDLRPTRPVSIARDNRFDLGLFSNYYNNITKMKRRGFARKHRDGDLTRYPQYRLASKNNNNVYIMLIRRL